MIADKEPVLKGTYTGTSEEKEALIAFCAADRDQLLERLPGRYHKYEFHSPAETVYDILVDLLHYNVLTRNLTYGQFALQSFSSRRLTCNARLEEFAEDEGANFAFVKNTLLAIMLGHIRLHTEEMTQRVNAPGHRESLPPGHVATWDARQDAEAVIYATTFLVPVEYLDRTSAGRAMSKARASGEAMDSEEIWEKIRVLAADLRTIPSAVKLALCDFGWLVDDAGAGLRLAPADTALLGGTLAIGG